MYHKKFGIEREEDLVLYNKLSPKRHKILRRLSRHECRYITHFYEPNTPYMRMNVYIEVKKKHLWKTVYYARFGFNEIIKILQWSCKRGFKNYGMLGYVYEQLCKELSFQFLISSVSHLLTLKSDEQVQRWQRFLKVSLLNSERRS